MDQPKYTTINPGGSLLIAWQLKGNKVVLVGGGEVAAGRIVNLLNADASKFTNTIIKNCKNVSNIEFKELLYSVQKVV